MSDNKEVVYKKVYKLVEDLWRAADAHATENGIKDDSPDSVKNQIANAGIATARSKDISYSIYSDLPLETLQFWLDFYTEQAYEKLPGWANARFGRRKPREPRGKMLEFGDDPDF